MYVNTVENIIHILPDIVYMIDMNGYFQYLNESVSILGYEPQELVGMHFGMLIHPDDAVKIRRDMVLKNTDMADLIKENPKLFDERRTGNRMTKNLHARLIPKNWTKETDDIYCEIFSIGVHEPVAVDDGNEFIGTIGVIRDITGLKQSEKNLAKIKNYYRSLIQHATEIYSVIATDGTILSISPSGKRTLGLEPYDMIGENITSFIHAEDVEEFEYIMKITIENPDLPESIKFRIKSKRGSSVYLETSMRGVRNDQNELMCLVMNSKDISEIVETQNILIESKEKYYRVLEEMFEAFMETDAQGMIQYCNNAMTRMTEYHKEDVYHKKFTDLLVAADRERSEKKLESVSRNKLPAEIEDVTIKKNNGLEIYADISISPSLSREGVLRGFRIMIRDITQKKIYENELKKAMLIAERSDRIKTEFITSLSHEIRMPMSAILGYTEMLLDEDTTASQREYLNYIRESGNHILSLINDLLDLSKIESGHISTKAVPMSLASTFRQVESVSRIFMSQSNKNLSINLNFPENISRHIMGDPVRIQEVFNNLMFNAIKFTYKGVIEFGCFLGNEEMIVFFVKDTGIGIKPEFYDRIFQYFQQTNHGFVKGETGYGLALAISKKLVDAMGGKIWVNSSSGNNHGTTFYFSLPYLPAEGKIMDAQEVSAGPARAVRHKIMIAEDNKSNLNLLKKILEKSGYSVVSTGNGYDAIAMYQADRSIDLMFMDIFMPDMDGYDAIREIRILEKIGGRGKPMPIIAITAAAMESDKEKCLASGFNDFVTKPVDKILLLNLIKKHLGEN